MAYYDLRAYLEALKQAGELLEITKEVDWDLEVGAIIRLTAERRLPAPLFNKIKGYPEGYRISSNSVGSYARLAIALGMQAGAGGRELTEVFLARIKNPLGYTLVEREAAPCKENILMGEEVDLLKFPAPFLHAGDGGRYIGTWHAVVTQDPDSSWVNWGLYRQQVQNRRLISTSMAPGQHIHKIQKKYEQRGQAMPFATAIGSDPMVSMVSSMDFPEGVSEYQMAGALRQEELPLVKCETNDLLVPATAEIIIEGEVYPHEMAPEGPFGEFTGYSASPRRPKHACRIKAITYRNDPILTATCVGLPLDESAVVSGFALSAFLLEKLRDEGIETDAVNCMPEACKLMVVIAAKITQANLATRIASIVWGSKRGLVLPYVVVVDTDVDPYDVNQVIHAIATKCHPANNIRVMDNMVAHSLTPFLSEEDRSRGRGAAVLLDCTWPKDWPADRIPIKSSFRELYPLDLQNKILSNWKEYGWQ